MSRYLLILISIPLIIGLTVENGGTLLLSGVTSPPLHGRIDEQYQGYYVYHAPNDYEGYDYIGIRNTNQSIMVYHRCDTSHIYSYDQYIISIPRPAVSLYRDSIQVQLPYYTDSITYQIGLCDQSVTCNTAIDYPSRPSATFPDTPLPHSQIWDSRAINCSEFVTYSVGTYANLFQCKDDVTQQYCINIRSDSSYVYYTGALRVRAFQSRFLIQDWTFPFQQRLDNIVTVISGQSVSSSGFRFMLSTSINSDGYMVLTIVSIPLVTGWTLTFSSCSPEFYLQSIQYQDNDGGWIFQSYNVEKSYRGLYNFSWISHPTGEVINLSIVLSAEQQQLISQNYTRNMSIHLYTDSTFKVPISGPLYSSSGRIYAATTYEGTEVVQMRILQAWLCWTDYIGTVVQYNPNGGQYGCQYPTPAMSVNSIVELMPNTSVGYQSQTVYPLTIDGKQSIGLSISTSNLHIGTNYLQIEIEITTVRGVTRNIVGGKIAMNMVSFSIVGTQQLTLWPLYLLIPIGIGITLSVGIVIAIIKRKLSTSIHPYMAAS